MAVRIRLRRMGRKKLPHYRVVVTDRAAPREGRFVETLGYFRPLTNPARLVLDLERVDYWIGQGALPSDTVNSLIVRARKGGDEGLAIGVADVEEEKALRAEAIARKRKVEAELAAEQAKAEAEAEEAPAEDAPAAEEAAEAPESEAADSEEKSE